MPLYLYTHNVYAYIYIYIYISMTAGALVRHRACIVPLWLVSCLLLLSNCNSSDRGQVPVPRRLIPDIWHLTQYDVWQEELQLLCPRSCSNRFCITFYRIHNSYKVLHNMMPPKCFMMWVQYVHMVAWYIHQRMHWWSQCYKVRYSQRWGRRPQSLALKLVNRSCAQNGRRLNILVPACTLQFLPFAKNSCTRFTPQPVIGREKKNMVHACMAGACF